MKCNVGETLEHTFTLTREQIDRLGVKLITNDEDVVGLKTVKERAYKNMPKCAFSTTATMHYIKAGPGCGKSYLIKKLATEHDLVLAPFTKLMTDYKHVKDDEGREYDLVFKTTHRAMESRGCTRIFVDEFTSLPYEFLACIVQLNGAKEVYLVGDDKQCNVIEPDEGMFIGNYIDLEKLEMHELLCNFRNPPDAVALMNYHYGYNMIAMSDKPNGYEVIQIDDVPENIVAVKMAFTKASAAACTQDDSNTVRSNQGGTTRNTLLFATSLDAPLLGVSELRIVGLSRHTDKWYIVTDNSQHATTFVESLQLPTIGENLSTLAYPKVSVDVTVEKEHFCVSKVLTMPDFPEAEDREYSERESVNLAALNVENAILGRLQDTSRATIATMAARVSELPIRLEDRLIIDKGLGGDENTAAITFVPKMLLAADDVCHLVNDLKCVRATSFLQWICKDGHARQQWRSKTLSRDFV